MMDLDFSNDTAATVSDYVQLPPGDWRCTVTDVGATENGTLFVTLRPASTDYPGTFRAYFDISETPSGKKEEINRARFKSLLEAAGVSSKFSSLDQLAKSLTGKKAIAQVRIRISNENPAWSRCEPIAYTKPAPGCVDRPMDDARWPRFLEDRAAALAAKRESAPRPAKSNPFAESAQADDDIPF